MSEKEKYLKEECPCGLPNNYENCCYVYHSTKTHAPDAETMMRARYSAYVFCEIDYLIKTIPLLHRKSFDRKSTKHWSQNAQWLGLEIVSSKETHGGEKAQVEFKAKYIFENEQQLHHERSTFEKIQGRWFFVDAKMLA